MYDAALEHPRSLLHLEHLCYLAAGILLWWPVFQDSPRSLGSGGKAVYLAAAFVFASPFGLLLSLLGRPIYAFYEHAPRLWGIDALRDQRIAGVAMTVEEAVLFFCLLVVYVSRFFREEETRDLLSTAGRVSQISARTSSRSPVRATSMATEVGLSGGRKRNRLGESWSDVAVTTESILANCDKFHLGALHTRP